MKKLLLTSDGLSADQMRIIKIKEKIPSQSNGLSSHSIIISTNLYLNLSKIKSPQKGL